MLLNILRRVRVTHASARGALARGTTARGTLARESAARNTECRSIRASDEGFTFIEILVAMIILLILIGAVGFAYMRYVSQARVVAAKNQIQNLSLALHAYFVENDAYPSTEQGLEALWEKPVLEPLPGNWNGPYILNKVPDDPWGNQYDYVAPGPHGLPFGIRSYGADGVLGGESRNKDISSWEE